MHLGGRPIGAISTLAVIAACLGFVIPVTYAMFTVDLTATVASGVTATVQWLLPQGRVGVAETNDDTTFYLTVRTAADGDDTILYEQPALVTSDADGTFSTPIPLVVTAGVYDVGLKGHQHLTRVLNDVTVIDSNNVFNFTQPDNSSPKGTQVLLAGDINGAGTTPATLGDDVVNAVDISTLLTVIDDDDPSGNVLRPNLNQDVVVNSVDLSLLISNLDVEGDN